jgi:hypothetical protein
MGLHLGGTDVAAGGQDVVVVPDVVQRGRLAEAGHVLVTPSLALPRLRGRGGVGVAAPGVVGIGDAGNVVAGQFAVYPVNQCAQLAGVNEERLAAAVAETLTPGPSPTGRGEFAAGDEPQADRDLRRLE